MSIFTRVNRRTLTPYAFIAPAMIVMAIVTIYPLIFQFWMSFTNYGLANLRQGAPAPDWVGLENYVKILTSELSIPNYSFLRLFLYNIFWALSNVTIHIILGVAIALLLNHPGLKLKRLYRALYVLPVLIPPIVVATTWRNMFNQDAGAVNMLLALVGQVFRIPPETFQLDWLRQVEDPISFIPLPLSYYAMLIANIWLGWPLNAVVATGALQAIPKDLYEAAEIDGAGRWASFKTITLTYLRPAMVPFAIYGFVVTFNLFSLAYFMSSGGPFGRTELLVTQAYRLVNERQLYAVGAAFAVVLFVILLTISLITNRLSKATARYDDF